jgi:NAD dependent epimerase/dehydratase family enzyme
MGQLFLDSQRVEPVVMKAFEFDWAFPDLESALRDVESRH